MHAVVIDYSRYSATTYLDGVVMVLPYPPSANDYWRTTRTGRVFVSKDAARYREIVKTICTGITPMAGDLFVSYRVYRPQKSGDLQNRAKVLDDALNGIAWGDDKQITKIEMERFDDKEFPRIEVVVKARETK
jgi:crossover junction endodeoxyribonuclease RusA